MHHKDHTIARHGFTCGPDKAAVRVRSTFNALRALSWLALVVAILTIAKEL